MADKSKKRKPAPSNGPASKRPRFQPDPRRNISAMSTNAAYPNGEINVKNFLKSHENEIKSLENAMRLAKKGLHRRAFQDVPRELRRRTASHNPQRVPKRLRAQAKKEIKEDNTPVTRGTSGSGVGKGKKKWLRLAGREESRQAWERRAKRREAKKKGDVDVAVEPMEGVEMTEVSKKPDKAKSNRQKAPMLARPDMPPSRFRRRQINKTWLPTHVWHSKRAFITPPKEPLWRFAIPLAPNVKAYRLTHRAATLRGAVAWDMSYMATIGLEGVQASLEGMLKALHFADEDIEDPWQDRGKSKKWRNGTRAWEGWIYEREEKPHRPIAHVTILWRVPEEGKKRCVFIRVHPSAFLQLWQEVVRVSKVQKPAPKVEDLRFEIGSIEIMGPAAAETLCSILSPRTVDAASDTPQALWQSLAAVTDPGVLPPGALLAFGISDPRLADPPTAIPILQDADSQAALINTLANWPIDTSQGTAAIFDYSSRHQAARSLPSQQSINRRKSACTTGGYPEPKSSDPEIPMLVYVSRKSKSWTALLPWKCVPPVWRGIMRYPVSTGGNPRFGGLKERRQVDFERSSPSFPFDHPGTDAGWGWELQERVAREDDWKKRPKGKRIEWSTIDLGNGRKGEVGDPWACDWERLLSDASRDATSLDTRRTPFRQLSSQDGVDLVAGRRLNMDGFSSPHLFTVKISMSQRGTPTNCARVYRLPSNNAELRSKWLSLLTRRSSAKRNGAPKKSPLPRGADVPKHVRNQQLAASLLEPRQAGNGITQAGDEEYPIVPDEVDLIGFVTTGNYNLGEGMPTAVANFVVHRVVDKEGGQPERICIVREAGRTIGRLATWEAV